MLVLPKRSLHRLHLLVMASTSGITREEVPEDVLSQDLNWRCAVIYLTIKIREGNDSPLSVIKHTVLPLGRKLYTCPRH